MRITTLGFWAMPVYLVQAAATGNKFAHRHVGNVKRQESVTPGTAAASETAPKFEGLRISYITLLETTTQMVTETQMQTQIQTEVQLQTLTQTETVQVTIAAVPLTVTQMVTQVAEAVPVTITQTVAQPMTMTELVTLAAVATTVTVTETVAGNPNAPVSKTLSGTETVQFQNGVGVSTIPIAESALPTTTFSSDPFATTQESSASAIASDTQQASSSSSASTSAPSTTAALSTAESSAAQSSAAETSAVETSAVETSVAESAASETSAVATTSQRMGSSIVMTQTAANPAGTSLSPSMDLGGLEPDPSAQLGSVVQETATAAPSQTRAKIDISTLSLSSVLNLGKLVPGTAAVEARATHAV